MDQVHKCRQCKLVLYDVVHIASLKVLLDNLHVLIVYTISNIPKIESANSVPTYTQWYIAVILLLCIASTKIAK